MIIREFLFADVYSFTHGAANHARFALVPASGGPALQSQDVPVPYVEECTLQCVAAAWCDTIHFYPGRDADSLIEPNCVLQGTAENGI